jgi:release factor glutamine methyltransferase
MTLITPDHSTLLSRAVERLTLAGISTPAEDVAALAAHALGFDDPAQVDLDAGLGLAEPAFEELVSRRAQRVPLSHLVGKVAFRGITLRVGPGVFTPQPETEAVVQWVADALTSSQVAAPLVVDLCTGSGTVAFAVAHEVPHAIVHAVERDAGALAWAYRNAEARVLAGDSLVLLHHADVEDCLPDLEGQLDLVVSNPPYVGTGEAHIPDAEVLDHDPGISLWAGEDGLDVIRLVERAAARLLKVGGLVVIEHSDRQGVSVPALLQETGHWTEVQDHLDQLGRDRFATARRR